MLIINHVFRHRTIRYCQFDMQHIHRDNSAHLFHVCPLSALPMDKRPKLDKLPVIGCDLNRTYIIWLLIDFAGITRAANLYINFALTCAAPCTMHIRTKSPKRDSNSTISNIVGKRSWLIQANSGTFPSLQRGNLSNAFALIQIFSVIFSLNFEWRQLTPFASTHSVAPKRLAKIESN